MKTIEYSFAKTKQVVPQVNFYSALVVDDYNPAKKMLGNSLWNFPQIGEVEYAECGEEALRKVRRKKYDLIFLDINMPGIDGYETCELIRQIPGYEITPIIMVSGNTEPGNKFKGLLAGCTSYINKPVQQDTLRTLGCKMFSWLEVCKAA